MKNFYLVSPTLIEYVDKNILPLYDKNEQGHGTLHIKYVLRRCFLLSNQFDKINYDILYTIAVYHDIAHHIDKHNHEILSAEIFINDNFMKSYFNDEDRCIIKEAIEDHRASAKSEPRSVYGRIISSADRSTDLNEFLKRTHSYTLKHYVTKSTQDFIDRAYEHATDKYGNNGYAKHYIKDTEYEDFLDEIRNLLEDKNAFAEYYIKITDIKK